MRALMTALGLAAALLANAPATAQVSKREFPNQPDLTPVSPTDALPPNFRGKVTYKGFYHGKAYAPSLAKTLPMGGDFIVTLEFNGSTVSGSLQTVNGISGEHAGVDPARLMGRREGSTCYLDWSDGSSTVNYCGRTQFRGSQYVVQSDGTRFGYSATIPASDFLDFAEADRGGARGGATTSLAGGRGAASATVGSNGAMSSEQADIADIHFTARCAAAAQGIDVGTYPLPPSIRRNEVDAVIAKTAERHVMQSIKPGEQGQLAKSAWDDYFNQSSRGGDVLGSFEFSDCVEVFAK